MKNLGLYVKSVTLLLLIFCLASLAEDNRAPGSFTASQMSAPDGLSSGRGKALSFDDEVVEGINKNPLDSLEDVAKRDGKSHPHLYRKRTSFRRELKESVREMGSTP